MIDLFSSFTASWRRYLLGPCNCLRWTALPIAYLEPSFDTQFNAISMLVCMRASFIFACTHLFFSHNIPYCLKGCPKSFWSQILTLSTSHNLLQLCPILYRVMFMTWQLLSSWMGNLIGILAKPLACINHTSSLIALILLDLVYKLPIINN